MPSTTERPAGLRAGLVIRTATLSDLDQLAWLHLRYQQEMHAMVEDLPPASHPASRRVMAHALTRPTGTVLVAADAVTVYGFCTLRIVWRRHQNPDWRRRLARRLAGFRARLGMAAAASPSDGALAYLDDLYVAPEARRRGAALPLLRAAFDWARVQGISVMEGATWANNRQMLRLAEHLDITVTRVLLHKRL